MLIVNINNILISVNVLPLSHPMNKTRGVSHYGVAIYVKKYYLKPKEEL
jgi:hypothetical protein